jgi:hypothetical protein
LAQLYLENWDSLGNIQVCGEARQYSTVTRFIVALDLFICIGLIKLERDDFAEDS